MLCPSLCWKVAERIVGCDLYRAEEEPKLEPPQPNRPYDWASCYLCGKELRGASKKGVIKHRNDPKFWGIKSEWKIMCLECIGKRFYNRMVDWQRKKFREYRRRGYE